MKKLLFRCLILFLVFSFALSNSLTASAADNEDDEYTLVNVGTGERIVLPESARVGATSLCDESAQQDSYTTYDVLEDEILPVSIIEPDARYRVTSSSAPYTAIAHLTLYFDGITGTATAFFVRSNILLTAAHNIVHYRYGTVNSITIKPGGIDSSIGAETITADNVFVSLYWNGTNEDEDYAIILMPDNELGNQAGILNLQVYNDSALTDTSVTVMGYPYDKPSGTLWCATGVIQSYNEYRFWHNVDTEAGQSGSPVSLMTNIRTVIGIDTTGFDETDAYQYNASTRITSIIIDWINHVWAYGVPNV